VLSLVVLRVPESHAEAGEAISAMATLCHVASKRFPVIKVGDHRRIPNVRSRLDGLRLLLIRRSGFTAQVPATPPAASSRCDAEPK
jgi:hypothetical protein